ncbi:MAG: hypothetical protein WBQ23_00490 [Bacteroidota bacterium]
MTDADYRAAVDTILTGQRVTTASTDKFAAHYTKADMPRIWLESRAANCMRQYDGDYMNDPDEGRYVVEVMIRAAQKSSHQQKGAFVERLTELRSSRLLYSGYRKCTFLSCWTTTKVKAGEEKASDSLNHWRFYGGDGEGACVMVPLANLLPVFPDQLYRVCYGIEARGGGLAASNRPVRQFEEVFKDRLNDLRKSYPNAMADLDEMLEATHPLVFLFKSTEYAAEGEVRSVVHKDDYANVSGVKFDDRDPKRAYVQSNAGVISDGSIIYFGPKANPNYAIEAMGLAADLGVSVRSL